MTVFGRDIMSWKKSWKESKKDLRSEDVVIRDEVEDRGMADLICVFHLIVVIKS